MSTEKILGAALGAYAKDMGASNTENSTSIDEAVACKLYLIETGQYKNFQEWFHKSRMAELARAISMESDKAEYDGGDELHSDEDDEMKLGEDDKMESNMADVEDDQVRVSKSQMSTTKPLKSSTKVTKVRKPRTVYKEPRTITEKYGTKASRQKFNALLTRGHIKVGDELRVPINATKTDGTEFEQDHVVAKMELVSREGKVATWSVTCAAAGISQTIITGDGPTRFNAQLKDLGLVGPELKGPEAWSNVVHSYREGQDMGTITQLKDEKLMKESE